MHRRRLVVTLPPDVFRTLERLAARDDRAAEQQATYILRHALARAAVEGEADARAERAPSVAPTGTEVAP